MAESETALQAFDYTVLPANMCTVIRANTEEFTLHMNRSVQEYGQACVNVMNVHAALADRYSGRWAQWCQSVGLSIRSATRMVEVGSNVMGSAKLAELVQDGQIGKSLLQAICAPSAEPEAVDQVLSGDITTHKEYQELLAQLKAEKERGAAAEAREEEVWKMHEEAKQRAETAESRYKAALADVTGLQKQYSQMSQRANDAEEARIAARLQCQKAECERDKAKQRAETAESRYKAALADVNNLAEANQQKNKELEAARKDLRAAKECYSVAKMNEASQCERIKTLQEENAALKKQPIAAVVDEEEMDKRAHQQAYAIAADMTGELRQKLERMQENDAAWVFQSKDRMESEWERMVPMLERMEPDIKKAALDGVLKMLGRIQGQAFALYPAEEEAEHEVPGTH